MLPEEEMEQFTTKDVYEEKMSYDQRASFEEYQKSLTREIESDLKDATKAAWESPERFMDVLRVMEYFSRTPGQLGVGAENALLITQKFQLNARKLYTNRETVEQKLYKTESSFSILLYQYTPGKLRKGYRTIVKAFDIDQLQNPPEFQEPSIQEVTFLKFLKAVLRAQQDEGFLTTYDSDATHGILVEAIEGEQPTCLILPAELSEEEWKAEAMYCFVLYEMSKKEKFMLNPETEFIARCAANMLCFRFGWQPAELHTLPQSVEKPGERRSLLNRVFDIHKEVHKELHRLFALEVVQ